VLCIAIKASAPNAAPQTRIAPIITSVFKMPLVGQCLPKITQMENAKQMLIAMVASV
jgi:hypothetical protein